MRAVQITLLFMAAMLWLGVQAAQTEPAKPTVAAPDELPARMIEVVEAG